MGEQEVVEVCPVTQFCNSSIVLLSLHFILSQLKKAKSRSREMQPLPQQFERQGPTPSNCITYHETGISPPNSSFFESSFLGEQQPPVPFDDELAPFDKPQDFYHSWHIPQLEYITDIQPSDGAFLKSKRNRF